MIQYVMGLDADDAKMISADSIIIKEEYVTYCDTCEGFGKTGFCPPHTVKPEIFMQKLRKYSHALVFKINVPTEALLTYKRYRYSRKIHQLAADTEFFARSGRFADAMGLAAGSCKSLFCAEHETCSLLDDPAGGCRHPDSARPSMSAFGIDVFRLAESAGWEMKIITRSTRPDEVPMGILIGMVLLE
ncbi:MAG: DUF2284 domain-containing protein [Desulfococcaceae bacterium]